MANKSFKNPSNKIVENNNLSNNTPAPEQAYDNNLIVNRIQLVNIDRSQKDIGTWRNAHQAAESIFYPNRSRLYDLYADVDLDGHLTGIIQKRIKRVLNKNFRFCANKKEVEGMDDFLNSLVFRKLCKEIMLSIFWGISGIEFIPGTEVNFKNIPRKHIKPEKKVIAINQTDTEGISYTDIDNIVVIGEERDLGLLLKCAFYVLLKKGSFSDWANYIEIFGSPLIITKYDAYDEKTKTQLTNVIENIGNTLKLAIPKQADFEVIDGKTSNGDGQLQERFKDSCNAELSVMVLGNTETTKSSRSSGYAQSKTHQQSETEIIADDLALLLAHLNSPAILNILATYGLPVNAGRFEVEELKDIDQQKIRAEVIKTLHVHIGLPIDHDEMYDEFGLNKPDNYEEQLNERKAAKQPNEIKEEDDTKQQPKNQQKIKKEATKKELPSLRANIGFIDKLRQSLADFFDPAHKD
jgi:hypothetical protein